MSKDRFAVDPDAWINQTSGLNFKKDRSWILRTFVVCALALCTAAAVSPLVKREYKSIKAYNRAYNQDVPSQERTQMLRDKLDEVYVRHDGIEMINRGGVRHGTVYYDCDQVQTCYEEIRENISNHTFTGIYGITPARLYRVPQSETASKSHQEAGPKDRPNSSPKGTFPQNRL